ncbi:hypothetical protein MMB75_13555 [Paenibacillus sp. P2(2022)]|uniref:Uncharacterized protein n=1 Tax=Paenibacillus polymyxa TaxID=1406 RepID=A0A0F6ETA5_PAEPO|nr:MULTISPECIES: hypothetical protein [Paenibacillus]MEB4782330.1 hypothetical protein [Paenibacillus jamilae]AHM68504.1 hypothetical protein PPSQR21_049200 [Paenibacillus polymyxa SQR-21]AIY09219.1 hypothetical protein LK13_11805 [Paenibacillus polymyxa]AUS29161.1 hypothetical protein C1A50_5051 [Paenibacillus polymyxa]MBE7899596.1 hypothetical protein [Paenibacillus polymyxa]
MAILLPSQFYNLAAGVGKSFFENLRGGSNATITVNNTGANPVDLVVTRVNAPVITYVIPAGNSLTLEVALLLVAALQATPVGAVTGTIQIATADF